MFYAVSSSNAASNREFELIADNIHFNELIRYCLVIDGVWRTEQRSGNVSAGQNNGSTVSIAYITGNAVLNAINELFFKIINRLTCLDSLIELDGIIVVVIESFFILVPAERTEVHQLGVVGNLGHSLNELRLVSGIIFCFFLFCSVIRLADKRSVINGAIG